LDLEGRNEDDSGALADSSFLRQRRRAAHLFQDHMSRFVRSLYRNARIANDIETLASGNPKRIARRAKNKILSRSLGRAGVWRFLWR
jgi:hypothetical protein